MKPFAESCEQNKEVILEILQQEFAHAHRVLEIGSGTGQHAVYFARHLCHLNWQTSDLCANHAGINAWLQEANLDNTQAPFSLDVSDGAQWPVAEYDGVFSANTTHIMSWGLVRCMFAGIGEVLRKDGVFCLYGPFNYSNNYTSDSNARFDQWLKQRDPQSGIRNFEDLVELGKQNNLTLVRDHSMPANNRILVWHRN